MKDLSSQSKSIVTNLCQILVPIILISFAGIIQVVMNYLIHKNSSLTPGSDSLPIPVGEYVVITVIFPQNKLTNKNNADCVNKLTCT